jgi:serine/threonine protein kinase/tetratricopeptide (TPR) repeat protein
MREHASAEKAIFCAALEKATGWQREAYLREACGDDRELLQRVELLLSAHEALQGPLDAPPPGVGLAATIDQPVREQPGMVIGHYKLHEQIGEGGFGMVFLAEQRQPVRRKVALKILKPGMDTRQVVARFEAERQALALMDHPNIARVFDGGETASGRPYFVMELVKGIPITDFCDQGRLGVRQRLELFATVCQAVQHAHQKGIIHRDLKPSNVLVTLHDDQPVVKVIDFGIAKVIGQRLTDKTVHTGWAQLIGTPLYMSPEQAGLSGLDVDTRSDIYALGVLLYELLTGTTPFDSQRLRQVGPEELCRIIREEEPPRPSTRFSTLGQAAATVATQRKSDPKQLSRLFRGELDWVVMKALEKDRNRRYETANGLAGDVQRYLANEPVQAGPASARYRLRKFVRRRRGAVLATGIILAVLLAGVAVSTWQAIRATRSEVAERRSAETARAINRYLIEDLFAAATPEEAQGRKITVQEVLDRASATIDTAFADQPEVEAGVRLAIGRTYSSLGLFAKAEPHVRRALELRFLHLGADNLDTLEAMSQLGSLCANQGKYDEAEHHHRQALDGFRRVGGQEHRSALQEMFNLAFVFANRHQHDKAEPLLRECLEIQLRVLGEEDDDTLYTMDTLAQVMIHQVKWKEAEPVARRCLEIKLRVKGENHPSTLLARNTVVRLLKSKGKWLEAERLSRENVAASRRIYPPLHRDTLLRVEDLGILDWHLSRFPDAEHELRECRDGWRQLAGADDEDTLAMSGRLAGMALLDCGKLEEADREAREALEICRRVKGPQEGITLVMLAQLGRVQRYRGRWAEAETCMQEAEDFFRLSKGLDDAAFLLEIMRERAVILQALGRREEARSRFWHVLDSQRQALPPDHPDLAETLYDCGEYLLEVGQAPEAKTLLEEALRIQRQTLPPQHPAVGQSLAAFGWACTRAGDAADGEQPLQDGLAIVSKALPANHWFPAEAKGRLGDCLTTLKRFDEAEPLLRDSYEKLQAAPSTPPARRTQAVDRLVQLYRAWGRPEKSAQWRHKLETGEKRENKPGP